MCHFKEKVVVRIILMIFEKAERSKKVGMIDPLSLKRILTRKLALLEDSDALGVTIC